MRSFPRWLMAVIGPTMVAVLAAGFWFYLYQERHLRRNAESNLQATARLKVNQIAEWRSEQLRNAGAITGNPFLIEAVERFSADSQTRLAENILSYFKTKQELFGYLDVMLVDSDGKVRLSVGEHLGPLGAHTARSLAEALREKKPVLGDLSAGPSGLPPHIDVVAPLFSEPVKEKDPIGAVIFRLDARRFLYPLIEYKPTLNHSAETLLVRKDGDSVLFLNKLLHRQDAALKLRIPLTRTDVPAVMAVLGTKGFVQGKDYRGVDVLSVLKAIPNSNWFMVAKVDETEALSGWLSQTILIIAVVIGLQALLASAVGMAWEKNRKAHYKELFLVEKALRSSEESRRITLMSIGDGLITADSQGRVEMINPVAETLTGWSQEEARGKRMTEVFRIFNEETRRPVEDPVSKVLREGTVVGLGNHTLLVAKDGTERPIANSGAPIRNEEGEVSGVVLVFRDQEREHMIRRFIQTRLSLIEYAAVHTLDELLTRALDEVSTFVDSPIGFYHFVEADQKTLSLQQWSSRTLKEFCRAEGKGIHYDIGKAGVWVDCVHQRAPVIHNDYASLPHQKGMPEGHAKVIRELVVPVIRDDKVAAILGVGNKPVDYTDKDVEIVAYFADVTWEIVRQKRAEETLRENEQRYRLLFENMNDAVAIYRPDNNGDDFVFVGFNKAAEGIEQISREDLLGRRVTEVFPGVKEFGLFEVFRRVSGTGVSEYYPVALYKDERIEGWRENFVYKLPSGEIVAVYRDETKRKQAEQSLEESRAFLDTLLNAIPVPVFYKDTNGRYLGFNKSFGDFFGKTPQELVGKSVFDIAPRDLAEKYHAMDLELFRDGGVQVYESPLQDARGAVHDAVFHKAVFEDNQGRLLGLIGAVLDITERKRAEESLRESEQRFRRLYEQSPAAYQSLDAKGNIVDVNDAWLAELGYERGEVVGKWFGDFLSGDGPKLFLERFAQFKARGEVHGIEFRMKRKDGAAITVSFEGRIGRDDKGEFERTHCVFTNITERRNAEMERERLASAIEQACETVVITDTEGTILYVNPAFETITGYTHEEAVGKTPRVLKSGEHDQEFYRQLWDTIKAGDIWSGRFTNRRKDGRLYYEDATISPVKDASGRIVNFVAVKRDITEHLELSRQLQQAQKMEAVGTLAGGIAHDFNNLLQAVLGYSELVLSDDDLPDQFRDDIEKILMAGRNGADLVHRLLTFSRKAETQPLYLDLNQRVRQAHKFLQRTIPKMIGIELVLAPDLAHIYADPVQMDQVIMNLAVNARDAMPEGGKLTIETSTVIIDDEYAKSHLEAKPGTYVLLSVSDIGVGMDMETVQHIFEPFYTTKGPGEGTGLGLAIVHGIVKQNRGFISCYSEVGHGTAFKVYLPAVLQETQVDKPVVAAPSRGGSETVLLVDDEELIRGLGKGILGKAGYTVLTAGNGREALEVYRTERGRIDLVILDLIMPEMGGKQCLQEIRKISPHIRVLIASGYPGAGETKKLIESSADGFVGKPYEMRTLLEAVRSILDA